MLVDLNDAFLRSLEPPREGRLEVWDTRVSGLVLRITPTGACTWSVRARTRAGKRTRPSLGQWPTVSIKDARSSARVLLGKIAAGEDPADQKRFARVEYRARSMLPTVSARLSQWQETRSERWSERYRAEVERLCTKLVEPRLGKRVLTETTRDDWTALIADARKRAPGTATWLYGLISSFLGHAEAAGWIAVPLLPRRGLNILAPRPAPRERILNDEELRAVWQASENLSPKPRCFVRLLIACAVREMEAADVAVGELNLDEARWSIPSGRTKNKRDLVIPLQPFVLAEVTRVWPGPEASRDFRLLGAVIGSGFRGFSRLKTRLDQLSGVTGWRWHDTRRSARSAMSRLGVPAVAAEAALNHVSGRSALERTYDRHDYAAEAANALTSWQKHLASLIADPFLTPSIPNPSTESVAAASRTVSYS